ncbi:hypothetical protein T265_09302 [Opisthorchis viverrini]|uniref:Uncharacterized protein n=1 Tax=Opisthorchis viverrini TaxID=6198 RepID=A0A075A5F6_OPIVI|nr:hypothetical protein T265_09302 [Opisthorchis viverrini]KER22639.1 hypothetical protein T265_09302 [Opisthorchis viverrini]
MALGSSQAHSESWPREEIADLFTMYSDNFSLMNHGGLVEFLQSTVSVSSFQKPPESSTTRQSRVTRPRKIKHVNLMHWEARHFYRTKSQRNINQPTQRPNVIPSSNNTLGTSRSRSEQRQPRSHRVTNAAVHSPRPLTHVNSQRQKQTVFPAIKLSQSEFRTIVQKYETDPVVRQQGRLSAQGFYRFLLSRDYLTLTRMRKFDDQMQTMRCPFSHYYLQCAQVIVQPVAAPFEFTSQDGVSGPIIFRNRINYIRALRQLLLLGTRKLLTRLLKTLRQRTTGFALRGPHQNVKLTETRGLRPPDEPQQGRNRSCAVKEFSATLCLLLECFAKPSTQPVVPGPGRGRQAEPELFIFPSLMTDPSKEQNPLQETSMREAYAIPIEPISRLSSHTSTLLIKNALLIRLLKILRQPATGFALLGANQVGTVLEFPPTLRSA